MDYNDSYGAYAFETDEIIFLWDDAPDDDYMETVEIISKSYSESINHIAECIFDEIGDVLAAESPEEILDGLGRPQIYPEDCQVTYCEHTFDDSHIICFEYLDESFEEIENITIDG